MLASAIWIPYGSKARASSSAYVQTPPIGSTVIRILRGNPLEVCIFINRFDSRGDFGHSFNLRIESGIPGEASNPFYRCATEPLVRRRDEYLTTGGVKAFGNEIVEGAVHVVHSCAAFCSVERRFDHSVASGVQM